MATLYNVEVEMEVDDREIIEWVRNNCHPGEVFSEEQLFGLSESTFENTKNLILDLLDHYEKKDALQFDRLMEYLFDRYKNQFNWTKSD